MIAHTKGVEDMISLLLNIHIAAHNLRIAANGSKFNRILFVSAFIYKGLRKYLYTYKYIYIIK